MPIPYFRLVRYYGAYNSRSKINKKYLFVNQNQEIESKIGNDTILCKSCNGEMIYTQTEVNRRNENWVVYKKLELRNRKNKSLKIAG